MVNEAEVDVLFFLFFVFCFFSGIILLSLWSNECSQFNLWFFCLLETQLVHQEVLGSHTAEAYLEEF